MEHGDILLWYNVCMFKHFSVYSAFYNNDVIFLCPFLILSFVATPISPYRSRKSTECLHENHNEPSQNYYLPTHIVSV